MRLKFMHSIQFVSFFILILFNFSSTAQAFFQNQSSPINFVNLSQQQNLSHPVVHDIEQDAQGFIWIATQGGLNRFDGKNLTLFSYSPTDSTSINSNWIWDIHLDSEGRLWVASEAGFHLYLPKQNAFQNFQKNTENSLIQGDKYRVIAEAPSGEMWFGSQDSGITIYNPKSKQFRSLVSVPEVAGSLSSNQIRDIHFDQQGNVWVATKNGGINFQTNGESAFKHFSSKTKLAIPSDDIRSLYRDAQGLLWVGTNDKGAFVFDPDQGVLNHIFMPEQSVASCSSKVRDIHQDSKGFIRLATDKGLCQWDVENKTFIRYQHDRNNLSSLISNNANSLFQDAGGVVWVSTYDGISRWNANIRPFRHISKAYKDSAELTSDVISAFATQQDGTLYVGTWGGGINVFHPQTGQISAIRYEPLGNEGLQDDRIMSLHVDADDTLWVGTFAGGLQRRLAGSEELDVWLHQPDDPNSLSINSVSSLLMLSNGTLAIGTYGGGLNLLDSSGKLQRLEVRAGSNLNLPKGRITSLFEADGSLWIGTHGGGVSKYSLTTGNFVHFNKTNTEHGDIGSDNVFSVLVTEQAVWLATQDVGVVKMTPTSDDQSLFTVQHFNEAIGYTSDFAYGLLLDDTKNIWVSHSKGISRIDSATHSETYFTPSHGLQGSDFNVGAYFKNKTGQLLFGGSKGFNIIEPDLLPLNRVVPELALVDAYFNKTKVTDKIITNKSRHTLNLTNSDKYLELFFTAIDYTAPGQNQYQYRWSGETDNWSTLTNSSTLLLAGLSDGQHTLMVRGSNNDGLWTEHPYILEINISPPWYRSIYAFLSYLVLIILLISYQRYHHRQILAAKQIRQEELEQMVSEKTIQIKRQMAQIELISKTDALTGAFNRRFLDQFLPTEINRIQSVNMTESKTEFVAFIAIDLDYFKKVNDTYGHEAGDTLLTQIVTLLNSLCASSDKIVRLGGEEFLIVSNVKNVKELEDLVERIRTKIAQHAFIISDKLKLSCTCSIGATYYDFVGNDAAVCNELLRLADSLMYLAKQNGRNAWVIADISSNTEDSYESIGSLFANLSSAIENKRVKLHSSVPLGNALITQ